MSTKDKKSKNILDGFECIQTGKIQVGDLIHNLENNNYIEVLVGDPVLQSNVCLYRLVYRKIPNNQYKCISRQHELSLFRKLSLSDWHCVEFDISGTMTIYPLTADKIIIHNRPIITLNCCDWTEYVCRVDGVCKPDWLRRQEEIIAAFESLLWTKYDTNSPFYKQMMEMINTLKVVVKKDVKSKILTEKDKEMVTCPLCHAKHSDDDTSGSNMCDTCQKRIARDIDTQDKLNESIKNPRYLYMFVCSDELNINLNGQKGWDAVGFNKDNQLLMKKKL